MDQESIKERLVEEFGEDVIQDAVLFRGEMTVFVPKEKIVDVCRFMRDDTRLTFNFLSFVAAVDRFPQTPRFELVYQLNSLAYDHRFRIKALVEEPEDGPPTIDSVYEVWPTADWHERETAEMFGIVFKNHPDPRKLLLPDGWDVHPLRKDFPLEGTDGTPDLQDPERLG